MSVDRSWASRPAKTVRRGTQLVACKLVTLQLVTPSRDSESPVTAGDRVTHS